MALPGSAQEVAAVVGWCCEHDVAIVPRGGGTGLMGGAVATQGGVVLSLERLRAVRELEPGLWRMLPEAGVTTRDVQRLARENERRAAKGQAALKNVEELEKSDAPDVVLAQAAEIMADMVTGVRTLPPAAPPPGRETARRG